MTFNHTKYRETKGLVPLKIENKEKYYLDLLNLEESWTGRMDAQISNTFILEAVQLIINSITLFEQGYFDSSFYSLRQSLEVSTTMTYLIDNDEQKRKDELAKWKAQSRFPMYSQMIKMLESNQSVFSDIKEKMADYFGELNVTKQKLNKYVHKQGFNTFYVSKNHPLNQKKDRAKFIQEYESYLKKCIGAIAVFRLTIDPFPILLNDEEIYTRTGDLMTRGYDDDFIKDYIGIDNIERYKETEVYVNHYDSIIQEESKNIYVTNVVKDQYIDKENIDKILEQKHLLGRHDFVAVILCDFSIKIAKVYCIGGMQMYFSSTKSKRESWSFNSLDFNSFKENPENYNLQYDQAFISTVEIYDEVYFIEHNSEFNPDEINELEEVKNTTHNKVLW
ncbi:teicoplanin resistance protein VanZ [Winogradskyella undariae]|uniref:teicoplanin resistance protein VanZ n=1 Tax=Winogradskyella undariae TaxID=1285465 RepID=UPI0015C8FE07|nr:teicoplanin resistance protein VanZ [Winogradskyella undariae]